LLLRSKSHRIKTSPYQRRQERSSASRRRTCLSRLTSIQHRQRVHPVQVQAGSRPTRLPGTSVLLAGAPEVLQWQWIVKTGGRLNEKELRDIVPSSRLDEADVERGTRPFTERTKVEQTSFPLQPITDNAAMKRGTSFPTMLELSVVRRSLVYLLDSNCVSDIRILNQDSNCVSDTRILKHNSNTSHTHFGSTLLGVNITRSQGIVISEGSILEQQVSTGFQRSIKTNEHFVLSFVRVAIRDRVRGNVQLNQPVL
jgi:hypothetical protein